MTTRNVYGLGDLSQTRPEFGIKNVGQPRPPVDPVVSQKSEVVEEDNAVPAETVNQTIRISIGDVPEAHAFVVVTAAMYALLGEIEIQDLVSVIETIKKII